MKKNCNRCKYNYKCRFICDTATDFYKLLSKSRGRRVRFIYGNQIFMAVEFLSKIKSRGICYLYHECSFRLCLENELRKDKKKTHCRDEKTITRKRLQFLTDVNDADLELWSWDKHCNITKYGIKSLKDVNSDLVVQLEKIKSD